MNDKKHITIATLIQAAFTLLSRIAGMIRDVMVSHYFGASLVSDAFNIAFTIPNVLRRFFGEGGFGVAFVPVYIATKEKYDDDMARAFFRDAFGFLLISLGVVTCLGMIFSLPLVHVFAYGFSNNPEQMALTDSMTKGLFPYVFMVSLVALFGAYLQSYRHFAAMSASPIFLNLAMIGSMFLLIGHFNPPVMVLVYGVLVGGLAQVILMFAALKRAKLWAWPTFSLNTEPMQRLLKLLGPALFGVFVYQLNIVVLRQLASFLGEGQITYYYNADRLTQFATGVFGVSIASAALPELSKGLNKFGESAFFDTLRFTMVLTSFVITPAAIGLMVFSYPIVSVLYVHGAFNQTDALMTAHTLMAFSPSLIAYSLSRPLIQAFYAQSDTRTPVIVGVLSLVLNLALGLVLVRFEVVGLALCLSISSFVQYGMLFWLFRRRHTNFKANITRPLLAHIGVASIACAIGLWPSKLADWSYGFSIRNFCLLSLVALIAGISYLGFAYYFKLEEAQKLLSVVRSKLKP